MPNLDNTGPNSAGPLTGRGQGNCPIKKEDEKENEKSTKFVRGPGRGFGRGPRRGLGRGRRFN